MKHYVYQKTETWRDKSSSSECTLREQCKIQTHGSLHRKHWHLPHPSCPYHHQHLTLTCLYLPTTPWLLTSHCLVLELLSAGEGARRKGTGSSIPICTPVSPPHIQTRSILATLRQSISASESATMKTLSRTLNQKLSSPKLIKCLEPAFVVCGSE